jgi:hypothetical protein
MVASRSARRVGAVRSRTSCILATAVSLSLIAAQAFAQTQADPHRPACSSAACKRIQSYLKAHYCGESPYGNGPDNGCEIRRPRKPQIGVEAIAEYKCAWSDASRSERCSQHGLPPSNVRNLLVDAMRSRGLPLAANGHIYFLVWKSARSGWMLANAHYSRMIGSELHLCDVLALIDPKSRMTVLHSVRFQRTDVDKPTFTQWSPLDLADVAGDGSEQIVLEADAYENHWFEVISIRNGAPKTIFSGLGYYL